ncbi:MAG: HlyD family efflux transporter periplasmic adaptor subunit [Candidatus Sericytochromatia bacterium]|nr:HlyD family efflux transporter periplasmic adaptor subunit [Candidatus Sericytochromatia bacterium]
MINQKEYYQLEMIDDLPALSTVRTSKSIKILSLMLFLIFISSVLIVIYMPWLQTVPGMGKIIAYAPLERQQNIEAPVEGRILKWYVQEGSKVKKGSLIAEISDNDPNYLDRLKQQRNFLNDSVKAAKERAGLFITLISTLEDSRRNAILAAELRVKMAMERVTATENQISAAKATLKTSELNYQRQKSLDEKGLTSTRNLELADLEYKRALTEIDRIKATFNAAKSEVDALSSDKAKIDKDGNASVANAKASYASALSETARATGEISRLDTTMSRQSNQVIKAARNGTILRLTVNQGTEMVKTGETIAIIVPDTNKRAVELLISGNDIPLVVKSENVRLQFEGWPALQFNGWPSVAIGTFSGKVTLIDSTDNGKGKFRVVVTPQKDKDWPDVKYLRQGVKANGWIIINQVPLWYEMWRQFNGFRPVIDDYEEEKKTNYVIKRKEKKD